MAELYDSVHAYLVEEALDGDGSMLDQHTDLIDEGVLDSLGIFSMTEFLEAEFAIEILPEDVTVTNFETIHSIITLIEAKRGSAV